MVSRTLEFSPLSSHLRCKATVTLFCASATRSEIRLKSLGKSRGSQALTRSEIEQRTELNLRHPEDLIMIMRDNPKILWDLTTDRCGLRNKYKHELLDHMRRTPEGLPNNQDFLDC